MTVTSTDFINWVDTKYPDAITEIEHRIVAGRAYYAAYHACLTLELTFNDGSSDRGVHSRLIEALKENNDGQLRLIGFKLSTCKNTRTEADYKLDRGFDRDKMVLAVLSAKKVIEAVESYKSAIK